MTDEFDEELERRKARLQAEELWKLIQQKAGGFFLSHLWWVAIVAIFSLLWRFGVIQVSLPVLPPTP